jgi:hypothetical protein
VLKVQSERNLQTGVHNEEKIYMETKRVTKGEANEARGSENGVTR